MEQQKDNLDVQRAQIKKHDKGDVKNLPDDYINAYKRQIECLKEQLDQKSDELKALHDKQAELRQYAAELKERAETVFSDAGEDMPPQLANAPASIKETNDDKAKEVHWENEAMLLRGQVEQLEAEIAMLKELLKKGGQLKESEESKLFEDKLNALRAQLEQAQERIKELEGMLKAVTQEKNQLESLVENLESQEKQGANADNVRLKNVQEDLAKSEEMNNVLRDILDELKRQRKIDFGTGDNLDSMK